MSFNQLVGDANAVWSLLLATGYFKVIQLAVVEEENGEDGEEGDVWYTLALTNLEVRRMFRKMVRGWFYGDAKLSYNNFIKALLTADVEAMNEFMNKIALYSFRVLTSQGVWRRTMPQSVFITDLCWG